MSRVLVIDPSASVRETLRIVLGGEHEVVAGTSLDTVPTGAPPDLVVLGFAAPPRDDRAAAALLRRLAPNAGLLLLHGPGEVYLQDLQGVGAGIDFLPKPFDAYELRTRVRELLG